MNMVADVQTRGAELDVLKRSLFGDMGIDGVFARTANYESVIDALAAYITRQRPAGAEAYRFPPVMSRRDLQKAGYHKSFPQLLGCVCCFSGDEASIRAAVADLKADDDPSGALSGTDLVLAPAACYPIYPIAASRGPARAEGLIFDVACDCFRREPSKDLDRFQSFRMREFVRIGSPEQVAEFRAAWMTRAQKLADELGLPTRIDTASDPFFGRGGQLAAISQIQQSLKFELLVPIRSSDEPTACMSFNYHRAHFGEVWGLVDETGATLHTGCVAFGMDRLAVALFATHGLELANWPAGVRAALRLAA